MNKIVISKNESGEYYATLKSGNGRKVWQTQLVGVVNQKTIENAIRILSKPFKVVVQKESKKKATTT